MAMAVKEQERPDWFLVSGARALRATSPVSYRDYVRRSANFSTPAFEDDKRQIDLDLPRTGASICEFILRIPVPTDEYDNDDEGGGDGEIPSELLAPYLPVLRNILLAYSMRNPRVGYVQGHADVVCFLIGNINERQDEEEVFWVYASIIERVFPEDFFARAPKLHGFQVDNRLFKELVIRKLVPHTPALAQVDLTLVTSLLSCKWFVSVWVGQLPVDLLRKVWDVMLAEEEDGGGAILHLLLGLHFFQTAIDSVVIHMATEDWDSSYLYKIILEKSHVATELDPQELLRQGHTMYGLNDEAIEDMRSTLRLDPQIRRPEFVELARVTKFNLAELEQLHEEFTFVRFHTKAYERVKLRGARQGYFESLVSREFTTWPVDICARLFQAMKPDGYGNVSFSSLIQLLSVLTRGEPEYKAALLFKIPDVPERGYLDRDGIDQLADLLCCLFANKTLADTSPHPLRGVERDAFLRNNTEQSPLLRSHFRKKLEPLAAEDEKLDWDAWWQHVQTDNEILTLMEWSGCDRHFQSDNQHHQHLHRKKSVHSQPSHSPNGVTLPSPINRDLLHARNGKNRRHSDSSSDPTATATTAWTRGSKKKSSSFESIKENDDRRRVSLLSKQMKKKFKISRALIAGDALRRNPFEAQFPGNGNASGMSSHTQLYWCQCTIS